MAIDFSKQLAKILEEEYGTEFHNQINQEAKKNAKKGVKLLKANSPKRFGDYAKSWAVKQEGKIGSERYIVHNKNHYRLTHLLEYGHVTRNQHGQFGTVKAKPHIAKVEKEIADDFVKDVERVIQK